MKTTPQKKRLNKVANRRAMISLEAVTIGSEVHEGVRLAVRAEREAVLALLRHHASLARKTNAIGPFAIPLDQAVEDIEAGKHLKYEART